jgi:hypothetical protein
MFELAPAHMQPDRSLEPVEWRLITVKQASQALRLSPRMINFMADLDYLEFVFIGSVRRIGLESVKRIAREGMSPEQYGELQAVILKSHGIQPEE